MNDKKIVRRVSLELIDYYKSYRGNTILKTKWTRGSVLPKPLYKQFIDFLGSKGIVVDTLEDEIHSMVCMCKESSNVIMDLNNRYALFVHRWNYQKKKNEMN